MAFKDRDNYLSYAQSSDVVAQRYLNDGWQALIFNEPLWLAINAALARLFDAPSVLCILIFGSASIVAYLVMRRGPHRFLYLLFLLIVPFVIKNHIIHLRQGVAIAIFFTAIQIKSRPIRIILLLVAPLVHSSFFVVVLMYLLSRVVGRSSIRPGMSVFLMLVASVTGMLAFSGVAAWSGARQAESIAVADDVSGLGFALWMCVLIIFIFEGQTFLKANLFPVSILLFYLASYFFTAQAGRILESGVLAVFLAALSLKRGRFALFFAAIIAYTMIDYVRKSGLPWFGWGI